MTSDQLQKAAFIQFKRKDTLSDMNSDLRYLDQQGYQYVFIDEVTLMEDLIEERHYFQIFMLLVE